jgi:hypothetical protein
MASNLQEQSKVQLINNNMNKKLYQSTENSTFQPRFYRFKKEPNDRIISEVKKNETIYPMFALKNLQLPYFYKLIHKTGTGFRRYSR